MPNIVSMSNREFSDLLADLAMQMDHTVGVNRELVIDCLRESAKRIKTNAEFQFDVRAG